MARIHSLFAFLVASSMVFAGCSSEPEMHEDWQAALDEAEETNAQSAEIFAKELKPTQVVINDTKMLMDLPDEIETSDNNYFEVSYPYMIRIAVWTEEDMVYPAEEMEKIKQEAKADERYKETVTDEDDRFVIVRDSYGTDEFVFWINKTIDGQLFTLTTTKSGWAPTSQDHLDWSMKMADSLRLDDTATNADSTSESAESDQS